MRDFASVVNEIFNRVYVAKLHVPAGTQVAWHVPSESIAVMSFDELRDALREASICHPDPSGDLTEEEKEALLVRWRKDANDIFSMLEEYFLNPDNKEVWSFDVEGNQVYIAVDGTAYEVFDVVTYFPSILDAMGIRK